ncbi:hypothetical protein PQR02_34265 [Paraburkholderia sediminicola]|uniref:Uncharacterized protein n=1 Tax=Paraburkholderia rhynchosiae TaxID=487049 RepID=A0ACC7NLH1_9BURK
MIFQFSNFDVVGLQEIYPLLAIAMGGGRSFHSLRPLFGSQSFLHDDAMVNTPFFRLRPQFAPQPYKTLSRQKRRSAEWLRKMAAVYPRLFVHWRVAGATVG